MDLKDLVITIRLRLDQVNLVLAKLGQCPYAEVAEVIALLKSQGDAAVDAARVQTEIASSQTVQATGNGREKET